MSCTALFSHARLELRLHPPFFLGSFLSESLAFFSRNFSIYHIFLFFFLPKYWNVNELDIFGSGEFHE